MKIELEETTKTATEIQTPYYAKAFTNNYCKFDEGGTIVITNDSIVYYKTDYIISSYYKNSTACTREEVETKFKEVINNLKNKI